MSEPPKDKLYYKIGEICQICQIEAHVLRYWESEFAALSPTKNRAGQRIYGHKDLELIQQIKKLLYEDGYTIAGANRKLSQEAGGAGQDRLTNRQRRIVGEARENLEAILAILDEEKPN